MRRHDPAGRDRHGSSRRAGLRDRPARRPRATRSGCDDGGPGTRRTVGGLDLPVLGPTRKTPVDHQRVARRLSRRRASSSRTAPPPCRCARWCGRAHGTPFVYRQISESTFWAAFDRAAAARVQAALRAASRVVALWVGIGRHVARHVRRRAPQDPRRAERRSSRALSAHRPQRRRPAARASLGLDPDRATVLVDRRARTREGRRSGHRRGERDREAAAPGRRRRAEPRRAGSPGAASPRPGA